MKPDFLNSPTSLCLTGTRIEGAVSRQALVPGFEQERLSEATILLVGAGGLGSAIARTLVRKQVGRLKILDPDVVEPSNLSRQHFYRKDIGRNKAIALVENLLPECTGQTTLIGYAASLQQALEAGYDLSSMAAICGVDNNPARYLASRHFRSLGVPVIFLACSAEADHGYVFVQEASGPCLGCLFPDLAADNRYPCPATPAVADILASLAGIALYATDTLLMRRRRTWNYRTLHLADGALDASNRLPARPGCHICGG